MSHESAGSALGRRERKKRQTRDALIDAALRLVAERGLENVTVEEISEAADVSSRTFFNYFGSKDEAITGDHVVDGVEIGERLAAIPPEIPTIHAIRLALAPTVVQMQTDQERWFLRMQVLTSNPDLLPRLLTRSAEAERAMVAAVAVRTGVGPDHGYPLLVTTTTGAAYRTAMIRWAAYAGTVSLTELVDEAFADLAAGLPDPARPQA
ncbi:TetR family transcriptional regulator [Micromonospora sp. NPDC049679]|uniref:TetR/AcrR family transcriptional regulator n=1 Tax=Micromonospora sp. NPDC049679 TaxID=3155920 RepID=UPI0033E71F02